MIQNARQYEVTKTQAAKFRTALERLQSVVDPDMHPLERQAHIDAITSQLETFEREISEYEKAHTDATNDDGAR